MSTRSNVGILNPDGTVRAVYVHWDGYPAGVGAELVGAFRTPEKINALLDRGDSSTLNGGFYKDRGEDDTDATCFKTKAEYLTERIMGWVEWQYLFEDGEWHAYSVEDENVISKDRGLVKDLLTLSEATK